MSMKEVATRIARLESRVEIEELKAKYSSYCDQGYDPVGISSLFVEDGVWEATGFGKHVGKGAIKTFMDDVSDSIPWAWHLVSNPQIQIHDDGHSAEASWYTLVLCSKSDASGGPKPTVMVGKYRDSFVRDRDGLWKFLEIRCTVERNTVLSAPWSR